ncbi:MAG TPA: hypothetical protein VFN11_02670 [Ktedonobacterales bacterium]|nr:hypothetical protein [Ktedonobacterales bacterium]
MSDRLQMDAEALTHAFRQIVGVVLVYWQRVLRVGLLTALAALIATEGVSAYMTASFPPPPVTHLVAVALAFALGYAVAITTLAALLLKGGLRFIRHLEGDAQVGARAAAVFAKRDVGDLGAMLRRTAGGTSRRATARPALARVAPKSRPVANGRVMAASTIVGSVGLDASRDVARNTMPRVKPPSDVRYIEPPGSRRDPDDALIWTPVPGMQALPVLATRLPRIEWTYDDLSTPTSARSASYTSPETAPLPDQSPWKSPPGAVAALRADQPPTHRDATPGQHDTGEPVIAHGTPDVPGLIPRGWHRNTSITRPIPAVTRPLPAVTRPLPTVEGGRSGGLWNRVSNVLVGESDSSEAMAYAFDGHPSFEGDVFPDDTWLNG